MDQVWDGCVVPGDLLYDVERHVWVRQDGDLVVLGMTDVAQTMGGRTVAVTWKRTGRLVERGRPLAAIESAKWVGPFPTPLTGELVEVNAASFEADIAVANRDPYGAGWLARLRPTCWDTERQHLLEGEAAFLWYRSFLKERGIRCLRCAT
jgi:glycine cleavage system H protein